jgi:hypothetical protein
MAKLSHEVKWTVQNVKQYNTVHPIIVHITQIFILNKYTQTNSHTVTTQKIELVLKSPTIDYHSNKFEGITY